MYIADLHIHSHYSRATSKDCAPEYLDLWAQRKGIGIVGSGDFTHPAWRQELEEKLAPQFIRVHRAYLVRKDQIAQIELKTREIVLKNGERCPFSRNMRQELLK